MSFANYNLTSFQQCSINAIAQRDDFAHFCMPSCNPGERPNPGPLCVLWYDTSEHIHAVRLGKQRLLQAADPA